MEPLTSKIKTQSPVCLYLVFFCGRENLETGLSKKIVVFTQQMYQLSIKPSRSRHEDVFHKIATPQLLSKPKKNSQDGSYISVKLQAGNLQLFQTS